MADAPQAPEKVDQKTQARADKIEQTYLDHGAAAARESLSKEFASNPQQALDELKALRQQHPDAIAQIALDWGNANHAFDGSGLTQADAKAGAVGSRATHSARGEFEGSMYDELGKQAQQNGTLTADKVNGHTDTYGTADGVPGQTYDQHTAGLRENLEAQRNQASLAVRAENMLGANDGALFDKIVNHGNGKNITPENLDATLKDYEASKARHQSIGITEEQAKFMKELKDHWDSKEVAGLQNHDAKYLGFIGSGPDANQITKESLMAASKTSGVDGILASPVRPDRPADQTTTPDQTHPAATRPDQTHPAGTRPDQTQPAGRPAEAGHPQRETTHVDVKPGEGFEDIVAKQMGLVHPDGSLRDRRQEVAHLPAAQQKAIFVAAQQLERELRASGFHGVLQPGQLQVPVLESQAQRQGS